MNVTIMSAADSAETIWCTGCQDPLAPGQRYCASCGTEARGIPKSLRSYTGPRRMLIAALLLLGAGVPIAAASFFAIQASGAPSTLLDVGGPIVNFVLGLFGEDPLTAPDGDSASVLLVVACIFGFVIAGIGGALLVMGLLWLVGRALVGRRAPKVRIPDRDQIREQGGKALAAGRQQAARALGETEKGANRVITSGANRFSRTQRTAGQLTAGDPLADPPALPAAAETPEAPPGDPVG